MKNIVSLGPVAEVPKRAEPADHSCIRFSASVPPVPNLTKAILPFENVSSLVKRVAPWPTSNATAYISGDGLHGRLQVPDSKVWQGTGAQAVSWSGAE
jgi:hypothetical protein